MKIRKAVAADIDSVNDLYPILFQKMAELHPDSFRSAEKDIAFLKKIIEEEEGELLLAEENQKLLGFALVQQ